MFFETIVKSGIRAATCNERMKGFYFEVRDTQETYLNQNRNNHTASSGTRLTWFMRVLRCSVYCTVSEEGGGGGGGGAGSSCLGCACVKSPFCVKN